MGKVCLEVLTGYTAELSLLSVSKTCQKGFGEFNGNLNPWKLKPITL